MGGALFWPLPGLALRSSARKISFSVLLLRINIFVRGHLLESRPSMDLADVLGFPFPSRAAGPSDVSLSISQIPQFLQDTKK